MHEVPFEEAASAFSDEHALVIEDPDHPGDEERFVLLGLSAKLRMPVLVHCYRERDEVIRLISARKAKPQESRHYSAGPS
jgi:hypothetical protein